MIYAVQFCAEHIRALRAQPSQQWLAATASDRDLRLLENQYATTVMEDGRPIACGGVLPIWENRGYLWSVISDTVDARSFRAVHAITKRALDGMPFRRLEAAVEVDFEPGHRWVRALGFELEAPLAKAFQVNGADCALYARVRKA